MSIDWVRHTGEVDLRIAVVGERHRASGHNTCGCSEGSGNENDGFREHPVCLDRTR